jgi:5-methylcytosine-specific restriction endonuclease McrA
MTKDALIHALQLEVPGETPVRYRDSFEYYGSPAPVCIVRVIATPKPPSRWGHTDLQGVVVSPPYIRLDETMAQRVRIYTEAQRERRNALNRARRKAHPRSQGYIGTPNEEEGRAYRKAANQRYKAAHPERVRELQRAATARRRKEQPEHMAALKAASRHRRPEPYRAAHRRRRARLAGVVCDLTPAQWAFIKDSYGHRCAYCHRKMTRLTQDHITPIIQGGAHTAPNIVPACQSCNARKHTKPPPIAVQPILPLGF